MLELIAQDISTFTNKADSLSAQLLAAAAPLLTLVAVASLLLLLISNIGNAPPPGAVARSIGGALMAALLVGLLANDLIAWVISFGGSFL